MDDLTELLALRVLFKEKQDQHEKEVREYRDELYRLRREIFTLRGNYHAIQRRLLESQSAPDSCTVGGI